MERTVHVELNRRGFLALGMSGLLNQSARAGTLNKRGCRGCAPMQCLRQEKRATLIALADTHLYALWGGRYTECPRAVVCEVLHYIEHLPLAGQQAICLAVTGIELYSLWRMKRRFCKLGVCDRIRLLNQGESASHCERHDPPLISWDDDTSLHTAITTLSTLLRLVVNSRLPARQLIGLRWSAQCQDVGNLAHVPPPPYPDLSQTYDVCVVGSGAGGAVVAALAAEAGKRVLIVEEGEWISPDGLVQRLRNQQGEETVYPAREDESLMRLFQGAGFNLAGRLTDPELDRQTFDHHMKARGRKGLTFVGRMLRHQTPMQATNLLQARVVGGGPYINNAIHLAIERATWERWGARRPIGISYEDLDRRMQQVKADLGVSVEASEKYSGYRAQAFVDACEDANVPVESLPVSILGDPDQPGMNGCAACGSDNIVDPFGQHIGGLHPVRADGPNSYLMRALSAGAQVAWQLRAKHFELKSSRAANSAGFASQLWCEDLRGRRANQTGPCQTVRATNFVLAAGAIASTGIVARTSRRSGIRVKGLGQRFNANVVTPVYAVFDKAICRDSGTKAEPGIAQCYYVRRKMDDSGNVLQEPALENWFHYPASAAIAVTGWFAEYVNVIRKYDHLSICGMVVPTKVRSENYIGYDGRVHLTVDHDEFELLLSGIRKIGKIYLAAARPGNGVTIYLPTRAVLLDECNHPVRIRSERQLEWALKQIRCRGPAFLSLATAHPQGGNSLGTVVDTDSFRLQDACQRQVDNLYISDASIFPAGSEINPQLTVKALATYVADRVTSDADRAQADR